MRHLILFIILVFSTCSFAQNVGKLHYAKSKPAYVRPPTSQIINAMNKAEERYYTNRGSCNDIELYILQRLNELTIDSININYRAELKRNLDIVRRLKTDGDYEDYTLLLMDIVQDLKINTTNYEDEQIYIEKEYELTLKKNREENERLKAELEFQKSLLIKEQQKKTMVKKSVPKKVIKKK